MAGVFDIVYFFIGVFVCCFFWWLAAADCCLGRLRRRQSHDQQAIVSIQREILRVQLQQDLQDHLRILQLIQGHNQNTTLANPEATEELAKLKLDRRHQIKFQLLTTEFQEGDGCDACVTDHCIEKGISPTREITKGATSASSEVVRYGEGPAPEQARHPLQSCNICLCDYQTGEEVSKGPICHHDFHTECIIDWLLRNEQCPICRQDFLPLPIQLSAPTAEFEDLSAFQAQEEPELHQEELHAEEGTCPEPTHQPLDLNDYSMQPANDSPC